MEHTPLTPEEYQLWKDTALLDGDVIDRFAATIDRLRAVNAKLVEELEWFSNRFHTNAEVAKQWAGSCSMSTAEWRDWEVRAREAIKEARK